MSTEQNTSRPKPHPFVPKQSASSTPSSATKDAKEPLVKKPFVRKPHLTERPFAQNSELKKLRESMPKQTPRKRSNNK